MGVRVCVCVFIWSLSWSVCTHTYVRRWWVDDPTVAAAAAFQTISPADQSPGVLPLDWSSTVAANLYRFIHIVLLPLLLLMYVCCTYIYICIFFFFQIFIQHVIITCTRFLFLYKYSVRPVYVIRYYCAALLFQTNRRVHAGRRRYTYRTSGVVRIS